MSAITRQNRIVEFLRAERAATLAAMQAFAAVSRMTVFRALRGYGYLTSYNLNSSFYTLDDIPRFDRYGLWQCREARFSRYGTLAETVAAVVTDCPKGATAEELRARLGCAVHNQLSALARRGRVGRVRMGRFTLYTGAGSVCAEGQVQARREAGGGGGARRRVRSGGGIALPEGLDAAAVLAVLVEMIRNAEASAASISRRLQGADLKVSADDVRKVIVFYSLGKKGLRGARPTL